MVINSRVTWFVLHKFSRHSRRASRSSVIPPRIFARHWPLDKVYLVEGAHQRGLYAANCSRTTLEQCVHLCCEIFQAVNWKWGQICSAIVQWNHKITCLSRYSRAEKRVSNTFTKNWRLIVSCACIVPLSYYYIYLQKIPRNKFLIFS